MNGIHWILIIILVIVFVITVAIFSTEAYISENKHGRRTQNKKGCRMVTDSEGNRKMVPNDSKVIVCLDSNHTKNHVLKELQLYHGFVNLGSYIVVFDTITSKMARLGVCEKRYINNGPKEAVKDFLKMRLPAII